MTTVGSLAYSIVANTNQFTQGMVATKSELRTLKDAFLASQSPVERYSQAIRHLEDLAVKFPDKAVRLRQAIAQMRQEMATVGSGNSGLAGALQNFGIVIDPVQAGLQGLRMASDLARAAFSQLKTAVAAVGAEMQRLDETAKKAALLGISEAALEGTRRAAADISGVGADKFDSAFLTFSRRIAEAAIEGTGEAAKAYQRLGLSVQELAAMSPDQAFLRVADAVSQVQNPSERLQLALQVLGKQGVDLATTLAAGGEKIRELREDQERLSMTRLIDYGDVENANDAVGRFHSLIQGLTDVLASTFAPLVKEIADDATDGFLSATKDGESFRDVCREIALSIANIVDLLEESGRGAKNLAAMLPNPEKLKPFMYLVNPLGTIATEATGRALNGELSGGTPGESHADRLRAAWAASDAAGGATDSGKARSIAEANAAETTDKLTERVEALRDSLQAQINTFGETGKATEIERLALQGVNDERLKEVRALQEKLAALEASKKAQEEAAKAEEQAARDYEKFYSEQKKFAEGLLTPAEKFRNELADMQRLFGEGSSLTGEARLRGLEALRDKIEQELGGGEVRGKTVAAIRAGSVEALRAQFNQPQSTEEKTLVEAKKQSRQQELMKEVLDAIKAEIAALAPGVLVT